MSPAPMVSASTHRNYAASTGDLTVTTGGTVSGSTDGIYARNSGHRALTITA